MEGGPLKVVVFWNELQAFKHYITPRLPQSSTAVQGLLYGDEIVAEPVSKLRREAVRSLGVAVRRLPGACYCGDWFADAV